MSSVHWPQLFFTRAAQHLIYMIAVSFNLSQDDSVANNFIAQVHQDRETVNSPTDISQIALN